MPILNITNISDYAQIPEHALNLMQIVSQGQPFIEDNYLFISAQDWLIAIAYPLVKTQLNYTEINDKAIPFNLKLNDPLLSCALAYNDANFEIALNKALEKTKAVDCWAIGASLPNFLQKHIIDEDVYYILPSKSLIPKRLQNSTAKAATLLNVDETSIFSAAHRQLWAEFMATKDLKPMVRELFANTSNLMKAAKADLKLLNAWDKEGNLVACMLMDYSAKKFSSYIIGAHSKKHYVAHAADLLFSCMLKFSQEKDKEFIHLGLGVNEGITRFKKKWGGQASIPYKMATWRAETNMYNDTKDKFIRTFLELQAQGLSKKQIFDSFPEQKPFAMLWELQKNGKKSYIAGTAHFFCYSFEHFFRELFEDIDTLVFEGPLDNQFLHDIGKAGRTLNLAGHINHPPLIGLLKKEEIAKLERIVRGPEGFFPRILGMEAKNKFDVRWYLQNTRPWCAMFSIWTAFLERQGFSESVDLEAWNLGLDMHRNVIGMESFTEQLQSLESVPIERVLNHFRNCHQWEKMIKENVKAYLAGNLFTMMGTSAEFPTRTKTIINNRDQRFRERMRPYIEQGRCMVFVGTAHMLNLRIMLEEDGFQVRRCLPTLKHRLISYLKNEKHVCAL